MSNEDTERRCVFTTNGRRCRMAVEAGHDLCLVHERSAAVPFCKYHLMPATTIQVHPKPGFKCPRCFPWQAFGRLDRHLTVEVGKAMGWGDNADELIGRLGRKDQGDGCG